MKSRHAHIPGVLIVGLLFLAVLVYAFWNMNRVPRATVSIGGKTYQVEVADNSSRRIKGLSGRASLSEGEGMLFVFDKPGNYGFWMKDMFFPIDIIWAGEDGRVVHIERSVSPDTYPVVFYPNVSALYVLELKAGQVTQGNFTEGEEMRISDINMPQKKQ